jgi:hypothetical protein
MELVLEPDSYRCAEHGDDLTESVRGQLEERVPVASFGRERWRSFAVVVGCPGSGSAHEVRCDGRVSYRGG